MNVLPTTRHVLTHLRTHMETAAYDAAHSDENGHGPLGQRYSLWQSCIDHVELLETDPTYAAQFTDLVMRRNNENVAAVPEDDERTRMAAAIRIAADLNRRVGPRITSLDIRGREIHASIHHYDLASARADIAHVSLRLGLPMTEEPHQHHAGAGIIVYAIGKVDGVKVRVWSLVALPSDYKAPQPTAAEEYVEPVGDGMQVRYTVNGPGDYETTLKPVQKVEVDTPPHLSVRSVAEALQASPDLPVRSLLAIDADGVWRTDGAS